MEVKSMKKTGFMEKIIRGAIALTLTSTLLVGCGKGADNGAKKETSKETNTSGETITVDFWTAPEQYNLKIWTSYADKFNEKKVEVNGKTVELKVQMMPAQPSSEAG